MKKVLCGTTALVAAGVVVGDASAASGLKLGISGYYRNSIGGSFGNSPATQHVNATGISTAGLGNFDRQNLSMRQEIRVNFTGKTTLDNGITVRVLIGLNGENVAKSSALPQYNRAYADFNGKFGLVRIGEASSCPGHRLRGSRQRDRELRRQQPERVLQRCRLCPEAQPVPSHGQCEQYRRGLSLDLWRCAHGLDRHLLRPRRQGQQDPVLLAFLRRLHLRRLLTPTGGRGRRRRSPGTDVAAPDRAMRATTSSRSPPTIRTTSGAGT